MYKTVNLFQSVLFCFKQYVSKAYRNEVLRLASVSVSAWEQYTRAFDAFENGQLKGQKLTKKQLMTKPEIKQTQFQCLLPLEDATQIELLRSLVSKSITLKDMKEAAERHKKLSDLKSKFIHLTNCRKWEEATTRFPQHATEKALEQFLSLSFSKSTPHVFSQYCTLAVKWQALGTEAEATASSSIVGGKCHIIEASSRDSFDPAIIRSTIPEFTGASLVLCHLEDVRIIMYV